MWIISITGKTGSGKSKVAKDLAKLFGRDALYIDVDVISRNSMKDKETLDQAVKVWGKEILDNAGNLDRKKFRKIAFLNKKNRDTLTEISLPRIKKILFETIEETKVPIVIVDWAFIPEVKDIFQRCKIKILVEANEEIRKQRILERDHITEEEFAAREKFAMNYDREAFDIILNNEEEDQNIEREIIHIYEGIMEYIAKMSGIRLKR